MLKLVAIAIGGTLGTLSRYGISQLFLTYSAPFALSTLTVNAFGSALIGFIATIAYQNDWLDHPIYLGLAIGFLGAFTTFSTFSLDTWRLIQNDQWVFAAVNIIGTLLISFIGLGLGIWMARSFTFS